MSDTSGHFAFCPHPWHGLTPGGDAPDVVRCFVEITRFDALKYEVDPVSGYLRVDRPQVNSCLPPMVYGFIPRTLMGPRAAKRVPECLAGDGDALDVCILSEHNIDRAEVLLNARILGGLLTTDEGTADPKLVGALDYDQQWTGARDIGDVHDGMLHRIEHYFRNYKNRPGNENPVRVLDWVGREAAHELYGASRRDYDDAYPDPRATEGS